MTAIEQKRFWSHVRMGDPHADWIWQGALDKDGYGAVRVGDKIEKAHHVAFTLYWKRRIPPGMEILHSCNNPHCVNPHHLRLGTHLENMQQKARQGRAG